MYTVIAHDFESEEFVGAADFNSLQEAQVFARERRAQEPEYISVWIQRDAVDYPF